MTATTPTLRTLRTTLRSLLNMFEDICGFVDRLGEVTSASQVNVRIDKLDELWEKVNDVILNIEIHEESTEEEEEEVYSKKRSEFCNQYYNVKSLMLDKAKELEIPVMNLPTHSLSMSQQPTIEHVRLPQIKLQTFDGNIDEWLSFHELCTSLIHLKEDLPDVEKFYYLKGCLAGEAKALVNSLAITRANYQIAWDILTKHYDDSKQLKRRQVQALFRLPRLAQESATKLQSLLQGFERITETLDQLVQPADYKDLLLIDILCSRLDPTTRRSWEELSSTKEQDTTKELLEFLRRRVKLLESLPVISFHPKKQFDSRSSYTPVYATTGCCVLCSKDHLLYQCPTFQEMGIPDRDMVLRKHGLCHNCFKRGHRARECLSPSSCRRCKGKHHSLICARSSVNIGRNGSYVSCWTTTGRNTESPGIPENIYGTSNVSGRTTTVVRSAAGRSTQSPGRSRIPQATSIRVPLNDSSSRTSFVKRTQPSTITQQFQMDKRIPHPAVLKTATECSYGRYTR